MFRVRTDNDTITDEEKQYIEKRINTITENHLKIGESSIPVEIVLCELLDEHNNKLVKYMIDNKMVQPVCNLFIILCRYDAFNLMEYVLYKYKNYESFVILNAGLKEACSSNNTRIVSWLLNKGANNFVSILTRPSPENKLKYVKLFVEAGSFDIKELLRYCISIHDSDTVEYLKQEQAKLQK